MTPKSPVLTPEFVMNEVVFAKDQPHYIPLPSIKSADGLVLTRWELTDQEREAIANGADVHLTVMTFNKPLQPVKMEIAICSNDVMSIAERMGLLKDMES